MKTKKILKDIVIIGAITAPTLISLPIISSCSNTNPSGYVDVASYCDSTGQQDCADAIQFLIDSSPNRTLGFRDGTYLLSHPIQTSSDPAKSVSLELSNFAVLKATDDYQIKRATSEGADEWNYMVQLGADRKDVQTEPGSNYYFRGGCIDGNGIAAAIEISGGRETCITDTNIKNAQIGIHVAKGVHGGGSADADIYHVSINGNDTNNSVGLKVDAHDNTFSNMRIGHCHTGIDNSMGGNAFFNFHMLCNGSVAGCNSTAVGIHSHTDCLFDYCYVDNYRTAFLLDGRCALMNCGAYGYGDEHPTYSIVVHNTYKRFYSIFGNLHIRFTKTKDESKNRILFLDQATTPTESNGRFYNLYIDDKEGTLDPDDPYKDYCA